MKAFIIVIAALAVLAGGLWAACNLPNTVRWLKKPVSRMKRNAITEKESIEKEDFS